MNKGTDSKVRGLLCGTDKPVHVCAYTRVRFGRVENVREHYRGKRG